MELTDRVILSHGFEASCSYPAAFVNITNRCNLSCEHCFIFRDANPNEKQSPRVELTDAEMLEAIEALRDRHSIATMLWMGGEPMLRKSLIAEGVKLFSANHIVTNGTISLIDVGPEAIYIISLEGPPEVNDALRGKGSFAKVMRTLDQLPADFSTPVQVQCTVTKANQAHLAELAEIVAASRASWMTFTFFVPPAGGAPGLSWDDLEDRMTAVDEVRRLKEKYPSVVRNRTRSLDLMSPEHSPAITANCLAKRMILPLYLERDRLVTPFCCYGNDVDCDMCGSWFVFEAAARFEAGSGAAPEAWKARFDETVAAQPPRGTAE